MSSLRQEATIIERFRIVEHADQESVTAAARRFDRSRTTVYKLLKCYQEGGLLALANRPRGPRSPVPEEVAELVVALKNSALHRSRTKVQQLLEERHGIRLSRQRIWRILSARGWRGSLIRSRGCALRGPGPISSGRWISKRR